MERLPCFKSSSWMWRTELPWATKAWIFLSPSQNSPVWQRREWYRAIDVPELTYTSLWCRRGLTLKLSKAIFIFLPVLIKIHWAVLPPLDDCFSVVWIIKDLVSSRLHTQKPNVDVFIWKQGSWTKKSKFWSVYRQTPTRAFSNGANTSAHVTEDHECLTSCRPDGIDATDPDASVKQFGAIHKHICSQNHSKQVSVLKKSKRRKTKRRECGMWRTEENQRAYCKVHTHTHTRISWCKESFTFSTIYVFSAHCVNNTNMRKNAGVIIVPFFCLQHFTSRCH